VGDVAGRYGSTITTGPVVGLPRSREPRARTCIRIWWVRKSHGANRFAPFGHALFGLSRERTGMNGVDFVSSQTDSGFATTLGGGIDLAVTPHLALRVVEADYFRTEVFNQSQNSFGLSFGILVGFGKHQTNGLQDSLTSAAR
jgi:hypothetical protein